VQKQQQTSPSHECKLLLLLLLLVHEAHGSILFAKGMKKLLKQGFQVFPS
jgi:hypothetical protein